MLPEGLVKVDFQHYFPVFNSHYTDKPTFILLCEYEPRVGHYCDRQGWWHNFNEDSKKSEFVNNFNFVYSDGKNQMH